MEQTQWIGEYLFTRKDTRYRDLSTVRSHEGRVIYTSHEPGDCLRYIRGRSSIKYVLHDPAGRQGEEGYYTLEAALERLMAREEFDGFALAAEIAGSRVNLCYRHTGGQYILSGMYRYIEYRPHKLLQMQILPAVVKRLEPNLSRGPLSADEPIYPFNYHLLRLHDSEHLAPFGGKSFEELAGMGYVPRMDDYCHLANPTKEMYTWSRRRRAYR